MAVAYLKNSVRAFCLASATFYPVAAHANDVGGAIVGGIIGGIIGGAIVNGMRNNHHPSGEVVIRRHTVTTEVSDRTLKIQQALAFFGFYHGTVDGRSGKGTRDATMDFQRKIQHNATGELTADEYQGLLAQYAEKTRPDASGTAARTPDTNGVDGLFDAIARGTPDGQRPPTVQPAAIGRTDPLIQANIPLAAAPADIKADVASKLTYSNVCIGAMALKTPSDSDVVKRIKDHLCLSASTSTSETFKRLLDPKFSDVSSLSNQCKTTTQSIRTQIDLADAPEAIVSKLREKLKVLTPDQRTGAIDGFEVCAGFGLSSNYLDFVQANAIALAALNDPRYLEFIASQAALGIGETPNATKAADWFDAAANTPAALSDLATPDANREATKAYFKSVADQLRTAQPVALAANQVIAGLIPNFDLNAKDVTPGSPPPAVATVPDVPGDGTRKAMTKPELVEYIRSSIVIVYTPGVGSGTGYFISPNYILTNAHVVEGATRGVIVANRSIGGVRLAKVIAKGMTKDQQGIDAAILEVQGATSSTFLKFSQSVREGEGIAIGGFPGIAQQGFDQSYDSFMHILGENRVPMIDAIPSPKFDFGFVQALMTNSGDGMHNIQVGVNTAHGNSGSPIVDYCGNAVGVHYEGSVAKLEVTRSSTGPGYVAVGDSAHFGFAIRGDEVIKFMKSLNIPYSESTAVCPE